MKIFFEVLSFIAIFWLIGLIFCALAYGFGNDGSDMLSQHYRLVINLIF